MSRRQRESSRRSRKCRDRLTYGDWVRVTIAPNQMVAGMLEGALRSEGIPVLSKKTGLDFPTCPVDQYSILVSADRLKEARQLLDSIWDIPTDP